MESDIRNNHLRIYKQTVKKCSQQARDWTYVLKRWHLSWKEPELHYREHLIFSSLRKYIVYTSHWEIPGGLADFHRYKMFYLANNEEKASTSNWLRKKSQNFGNSKNCSSRADINLDFNYFGHSLKIVIPIVLKQWKQTF